MKKLTIALVCFDIAIIAMLCMGYPQKWFPPAKAETKPNQLYYNTSAPSSQENSEVYTAASETSYYLVREFNGHIGIFRNGGELPFDEISVEVSGLPQADQELLNAGILVDSEDRLRGIIEDYES